MIKKYILFLIISILPFFLLPTNSLSAQSLSPRHILILNSYHQSLPWVQEIVQAIYDELQPYTNNLILHIENMDTKRVYNDEYVKRLYHVYMMKYRNVPLDIIIASDNNAFDFLRTYRDRLFPEVPVVFCGVNSFQDSWIAKHPGFTGVIEKLDALGTIQLALKLHPDTKEIFIIHDNLTTGILWEETIKQELQTFKTGVKFTFSPNVSMKELEYHLRNLDERTLVLLGPYSQDKQGQDFEPAEVSSLIAQASPVPVYCLLDFNITNGIVGGSVSNGYNQGKIAASMTQQILNGENPDNIPVFKEMDRTLIFDYIQLERFNISLSQLPAESIILNKIDSFYETHKRAIWAVFIVVISQAVIILTLLYNIRGRIKAEKSLHEINEYLEEKVNERTIEIKKINSYLAESEDKYRNLVERSYDGIIIIQDGLLQYANTKLAELLGYTVNELLHQPFEQLIASKQSSQITARYYRRMNNEDVPTVYEIQLLHKSGERIYVEVNASIITYQNRKADCAYIHDLTRQRKGEQALRESEDRYRKLSNLTFEGILLHQQGVAIDVNQSLTHILGYEREELLGKNLISLLVPPQYLSTVMQNTSNNHTHPNEIELIRKGGKHIPVEIESRNVIYNDEELRVTAIRDITKRKKSEDALRESREKFRMIFENSSVGIVLATKEGKIHSFNPAFQKLLGYTPEKIVDSSLKHFTHPEDAPKEFELFSQLIRNEQDSYQIEKRCIKKNGKIIWVRLNATCLRDKQNQIEFLLTITEDITQRKQAEDALKASKERYRTVVEDMPAMICRFLDNGTLMFVNEMYCRNFRKKREELIGQNFFQFIPKKERKRVWKHYSLLTPKNPVITYEHKVLTPEGDICWQRWTDRGIFDDHGNPLEYQSIGEDITERRQAEEALKKAKDAAESANHAKSEFLANMSHEIRTPMNAILGYTELLTSQLTEPLQKKYLSAINTSGKILLELINDILDLSKIEAGKMKLEYSIVEPQQIFKDIARIFTRKVSEKGLEFKIEMDSSVPYFLVLDETRLRQILLNLVSNAVKFTHTGYIKLSACYSETTSESGSFCFSVTDSGIGIAEEQQDIIFGAFEQQAGQDHAKYGGTGLGLAITKRLVELMGGTISLLSEQGKGSSFKVCFNKIERLLFSGTSASTESSPDLASITFEPAQILLVDDLKFNRDLLKAYLSDHQELMIFEAEHGQEAIELALKYQPDLILMDRKMPVMDGCEAIKRIKLHDELKTIPVIMSTASVMLPQLQELKEISDGFIEKPISKKKLIKVLARFLKFTVKEETNAETSDTETEHDTSSATVKPETLSKLRQLAEKLQEECLPQWQQFVKLSSLDINGLIDFGHQVKILGEHYRYLPLSRWGKTLETQAKMLDLTALPVTLKTLPDQIEHIKKLIHTESTDEAS